MSIIWMQKLMGIDVYSRRQVPVLAIVVPCFNEEESIPSAAKRLLEILDKLAINNRIGADSFIYFVDDGSVDNSWKLLSTIRLNECRIKGLKLSRNFGHQNALLAGLLSIKAKCDISISIDADLQQNPDAIEEFVESYMNGADVVFGIRNDRYSDGLLKKASALAFYRLMSWMGVKMIKNHADYRLLSKPALNALADHSEPNLFLRAICTQLGFNCAFVHFDV